MTVDGGFLSVDSDVVTIVAEHVDASSLQDGTEVPRAVRSRLDRDRDRHAAGDRGGRPRHDLPAPPLHRERPAPDAVRRCARPASDRWRLGLIRFGDNALEWFTLGGVSVRPRHRWLRQRLLLEAPVHLAGSDAIPVLPDAYRVPCTDGDDDFELALQGPDYTALRSWQEAAPPGYNVNVA